MDLIVLTIIAACGALSIYAVYNIINTVRIAFHTARSATLLYDTTDHTVISRTPTTATQLLAENNDTVEYFVPADDNESSRIHDYRRRTHRYAIISTAVWVAIMVASGATCIILALN